MWLGCKASLIPYTLPRDSYKNQEGNSRYHYKSCNYQKDNNGLNQIAYDYTVELTNRFKGLDLIECVRNYGRRFVTLYKRQWSRPYPRKRNAKKMVVWGGLTNSWEKKRSKKAKEKEKFNHLNAEFQRMARRDKNAFLSDQCKETEENNRMGKTRDLFKKIRDIKGTFHAKWGSIKQFGPNRSRRY